MSHWTLDNFINNLFMLRHEMARRAV